MSPVEVGRRHEGVRRHLARTLTRAALVWGVVTLAVVLLAAWGWAGPAGWTAGSIGPLALDLVFLVLVGTGLMLGIRFRRVALREARVARSMETAAGLPGGTVIGSLELSRGVPGGVSEALVARGAGAVAARLDRGDAELAGEDGARLSRWLRRGLGALAVLVPLLMLALVASPGRSLEAWRGLGAPLGILSGPSLPPLTVEPGSVSVPRGATLSLRIGATGRDDVTLHWQAAGDVARTEDLSVLEGRTTHVFAEVSAAMEYWVSAPDGARSPVFEVTPVDPLFVTDVTVRIEFPAHTGRPAEEYRGEVPPLQVPIGSRLEVEGRGSRELAAAELVPEESGPDGAAAATFTTRGADFAGAFLPRRSGAFDWRFVDAEGAPAELVPAPLRITLIPDLPPVIEITLPGPDTVLPLNRRQPLVIQAADDYGLDRLELVAWRVTAMGDSLEPNRQQVDLAGVPGALARPLLDVSEWGLLPGDQVRYYARVLDNAPSPQEARTSVRILRMPGAAELRRGAQHELERTTEELERLTEQARRTAEAARNLQRESQAPDRTGEETPFRPPGEEPGEMGFEEREELARSLEEQREMAAEVDSLSRELGELSDALEEAGARDPELRDDLAELQELLAEVAGPELQSKLEEMAARMNEMDQRSAREAMEQMAREQEAFRERIEEALDRMKRAAVEQDFRATREDAQELADEEAALAEAMTEEDQPELRADQQEELAERAEETSERMERLQERLDELGEADAAAGVREALESAQEAVGNMDQAAEQSRDGQNQQAGQQASQAAQEMSEAARELQQAQQQMMQERAEALAGALEQTTQDALALARRQAELREEMRGASPDRLSELRADVAAVEQGVRNAADNLSLATRAAGAQGMDREIGTALGEAMGALQQTVGSLDAPSSAEQSPGSAAEQAVDALNRAAMQAVAAARQLAEGGDPMSASEQMLDALERLAQQQADVNNQASQMMPMQLTPQQMQQQMQQMQQGQQSVASDLGELSNQEGDGPLGDLQALAQEAEALAQELGQGRLEPDVRRRQERLFHRLLDAGRSLEKEEFSEERESQAAAAFEEGDVAALDRDALGLLRFRAPDAEALRRLPPAARTLVLQYFQRLNQGGAAPTLPPVGGGGGG